MAEGVVVKKFSCDDLPRRCFTSFDEMRSDKQLCDYTFKVEEVSISAHRVILAAVIPYYRNMFSKNTEEVPDVEPNMLACLIDYAYTHEVSIDTNNVKGLLAAADLLGMDEVIKACSDFLSDGFKSETVRNDQDLASGFDISERLEVTDCDIRDNFNVISETAGSLNNPVTNLKHVAGKDDRNIEDEKMINNGLCSMNNSRQDPENDLPELQSESRKRVDKLSYLRHVEDSDSSFERRQVVCSSINQPKRKKEYASNEQVQKPCIYKLNVNQIYTVQRFNLLEEEWITEKRETILCLSEPAVPLENKIYSFRFGTTLQYDPKDNSFESMSCMPTFRDYFGATGLNNSIYICGGKIGNFKVTNAVECFHPATDAWETVTPMPTPRLCLNAVTLDEYIFVIGGTDANTVYRTVEKYDRIKEEWTSMSPMLVERWAAGAATLNDKIYVCGGISANHDAVSRCEVYYAKHDDWVYISSLNYARYFCTLLAFQQKLHAIGGLTAEGHINVFDIYNPKKDKWTFGPSTDRDVFASSAVVLADAEHEVPHHKVQ